MALRIHRDSIVWLVAAAAAFTLAVMLFTPMRMSLGWDETVYASQISQHVPIMRWSSERARGMPLLVAPVTLFTDSAVVLRFYLALLAGAGLFLALLAWRGLRPAWLLALAGVIFGGLWVTQSLAPQLFPNYWIGIGALASAGLFLRGLVTGRATTGILAALAAAVAFAALMRPADAVFLAIPLLAIAAVRIVRHYLAQRSVDRCAGSLVLAIAVGLAIGLGDWIVESYLYFTDPVVRLQAAGRVTGGTRFDPVTSLRILSGGRASSLAGYPGITGWSHPGLLPWWLAFAILAAVGVYAAARTTGWLPALVPVLCALSIYILYSLPVRDNARYLIPVWALLAIPAADGIAWLVGHTRKQARVAAVAAAAVFLLIEFGTQHTLLTTQSTALQTAASANTHAAQALQQLGVHAPCVVTTLKRPSFAPVSEPAAYHLGCAFQGTMGKVTLSRNRQVVVLVQGPARPGDFAMDWRGHRLASAGDVTAYIGRPAAR